MVVSLNSRLKSNKEEEEEGLHGRRGVVERSGQGLEIGVQSMYGFRV